LTDSSSPNSSPHGGSKKKSDRTRSAYLFTPHAGRFSDIYRLSSTRPASLGRAGENPIVIHSEQASRHHAEIRFDAISQRWTVVDLSSRNGTFVNGQRIDGNQTLEDDDVISVAGFPIRFHHQLDGVRSESASGVVGLPASADSHATSEFDPASIAQRIQQSGYFDLHSKSETPSETLSRADDRLSADVARTALLKLSFEIGRCENVDEAIDLSLESLQEFTAADAGGVYRLDEKGDATLLSILQTDDSAYRGITPPMQTLIHDSTSGAILARNISASGDACESSSSIENSLGQINVQSMILAAIDPHQIESRQTDTAVESAQSARRWGVIHLMTKPESKPLESSDLQFAMAVAQILALRLRSIEQTERLTLTLRRSQRQVKWLKDELGDRVQLIGRSDSIAKVIEQVRMAAPTSATVLVRGESGVGKELIASAIHHASARSDGPLVCMNCAALSPMLLESELFGHEKGSFTGATERKRGKFELANGGTILLDEIGEMSSEIQAKFLRVLEGHPFERVGGHEPIRVSVRVVAATNRDLREMVSKGQFRQDLYYRLHVVEITVPPLRQRGRDVLLLAEYFLARFAREMGRPTREMTQAAQKRLLDYSWPGNIRELRNVIERAVVLSQSPVIDAVDLLLSPAIQVTQGSGVPTQTGVPIEQTLAQLEMAHIDRVLKYTEGNKSRAATILGIERSTLDRKLKRNEP
jgi:transcriptional regulator with GAF, ATPase, and Fis domain